MPAGAFIKNNLALVAGLAIPVLMVAGFLVLSQAGKLFTDPPRHIAYFVAEDTAAPPVSAGVELRADADGRIAADITPYDDKPPYRRKPVLLAFDAAKGTIERIAFTLPPDTTGEYLPPEYASIRLTGGQVAPDGYEIAYAGGHSGLIVDVFIRNSMRGYRIRKGAASYTLPDRLQTSLYPYNYGYARFLGWSQKPEAAQ